eukprot:gene7967-5733_t
MWSFVQRLLGQPTEHRPKPSLSALDNSTFDRTKCVVHEVPEEFCHQDYNSDRRQVAMVIDNILSQEECARWIAETEARGYEQALLNVGGGQQILVTEVRKSLRCTVTDFDRVAELWQRVQPFLPEPLVFRDEYIPRELNELLRFLRYDPGDYFRPHMDGSFVHPADHPHADDRSFMTMFLYLNEGYEGGHTSLFATNDENATYYAKAHPECLYDPIFVRRRLYRTTVPSPTTSPAKPTKKKAAAIASHGSSDSEESKDDPAGRPQSTRSRPSSAQPTSDAFVTPPKNAAAILPSPAAATAKDSTVPVKLSQLFASEKWQRFLRDWEVPPDKPIKISARPEKPGPRWESQGIGSTAVLKVDIPTDAEVASYQRRLMYWRTKRTLAKPVNFCRVTYRYRKKVTLRAPRENSLVFNGHTIFAKAIMDTVRTGAACITSEDSVRLDTFFACVYGEMKKQVQAMREKQALDEEFEKQRVAAAIAAAIAGEEDTGGEGGGGGAGAAAEDADSVTRKKKAGTAGNKDAKKKAAAKDKKKKEKKGGKKKGAAKEDDKAVVLAQTPALFLPTIGVLPPDRRLGPSAFTQLLTTLHTQLSTVFRRLSTATSRSSSSTTAAATRRRPLPSSSSSSSAAAAVSALSNKKPVSLTPALADPYLTHRLYFRCGPPPAPERPFITFVTPHTVSLTWYNPPFDGIAPLYYRLQMENVSRNFHEWQYLRMPGGPSDAVLYLAALDGLRHFEDEEEDRRRGLQQGQGYAYYCIRETHYVVRDLPSGIACRFRVQAFNPAGWSSFSIASDYVTPGEEQTPLPSHMGLRGAASMSRYLGAVGLVRTHEMYQPVVNFPPPESEKDGDDWSDGDDDEDDEAEQAALDEMMRERQAALQSKEKQEQQERLTKEKHATAAAAEAGAAAAAAAKTTTTATATGATVQTKIAASKKKGNVTMAADTKAR